MNITALPIPAAPAEAASPAAATQIPAGSGDFARDLASARARVPASDTPAPRRDSADETDVSVEDDEVASLDQPADAPMAMLALLSALPAPAISETAPVPATVTSTPAVISAVPALPAATPLPGSVPVAANPLRSEFTTPPLATAVAASPVTAIGEAPELPATAPLPGTTEDGALTALQTAVAMPITRATGAMQVSDAAIVLPGSAATAANLLQPESSLTPLAATVTASSATAISEAAVLPATAPLLGTTEDGVPTALQTAATPITRAAGDTQVSDTATTLPVSTASIAVASTPGLQAARPATSQGVTQIKAPAQTPASMASLPVALDGDSLEMPLTEEPATVTLQTALRGSVEGNTPPLPADAASSQASSARSEGLMGTGLTSPGNATAATAPGSTSSATTLAAPFGSPQWPRQLGEQVMALQQRGDQQIELRLNPAELGPLSISLKLGENAAHLQFFSAHPQVRSAIEQALPQLREALAEQGISLGQTSVGEQHQQPSGQTAETAATTSSAGREPSEEPLLEQAMARASQRLNALDGRIDLYA